MKIYGDQRTIFDKISTLQALTLVLGLFFGLVSVEGERSRMPSINLRGRCGFGTPCDENRLSYGCETFGGNFGVCWSECIGNLPSIGESGTPNGSFVYEGWCYNINSHLALESGYNFFSGKVARVSRRDVNEPETEEDYQEYMAQVLISV